MQAEVRYYGFSLVALGAKAIIDLVRGSAGMADEPWDVHRPVDRRRRRKLFGAKPKRIPLAELVEIAVGKFGWQINNASCDILDLGNGLRQAAVDREVTLYGRSGCLHMPQQFWDNYPLQPIPVEHLCSHWIDIASALHDEIFETKKVYAVGSTDHGAVGFVDLWVDRKQALKWLKHDGREWRGRTDAHQGGPESMRQAIWEQLEGVQSPPPDEPVSLNEPAAREEPLALEEPAAPEEPSALDEKMPLMIER